MNNVMLFCKGDTKSIKIITDTLIIFAGLSSLQINHAKNIFFFDAMNQAFKEQLAAIARF